MHHSDFVILLFCCSIFCGSFFAYSLPDIMLAAGGVVFVVSGDWELSDGICGSGNSIGLAHWQAGRSPISFVSLTSPATTSASNWVPEAATKADIASELHIGLR
jgi:hypothetical protein